jgi:hypothetical protein
VLGRDPRQLFAAAAADDDGVAPGLEPDGEGEADAAGGAGDEDGVSGRCSWLHCERRVAAGAETSYRGIGDPWVKVGRLRGGA